MSSTSDKMSCIRRIAPWVRAAPGARWIAMAMTGLAFINLAAASDDLALGKTIYSETCIACHGGDGAGSIPGVPDLNQKAGPLSENDNVLLQRMVDGFQSAGSPMPMPPRGGVPALTDADLKAALKYMRKQFQPTK